MLIPLLLIGGIVAFVAAQRRVPYASSSPSTPPVPAGTVGLPDVSTVTVGSQVEVPAIRLQSQLLPTWEILPTDVVVVRITGPSFDVEALRGEILGSVRTVLGVPRVITQPVRRSIDVPKSAITRVTAG